MNYDTCTLDELREALAILTGWTHRPEFGQWHHRTITGIDGVRYSNPVEWTLDEISTLMPESHHWDYIRQRNAEQPWYSQVESPRVEESRYGSQGYSEIEARARCLAKVLAAGQKESHAE